MVKKLNDTIRWAFEMVKHFRRNVGMVPIHPRGLHYHIVSKTTVAERTIPGNSELSGEYLNEHRYYAKLTNILADGRVLGLIPFDWILDMKNPEVREKPSTRTFSYNIEARINHMPSLPDFDMDEMGGFKEWTDSIRLSTDTYRPRFNNQRYHTVIVIEKTAYDVHLQPIAERFGADYMSLSGQPSVTRTAEVCSHAKMRGLPLRVIYLSDLDVAGAITMISGISKRVKQIYNHKNNVIKRILLTRKQAEQFKLPPSFKPGDKKYAEKLYTQFENKTGSRSMTELDALPLNEMIRLVREELELDSGIALDSSEYDIKRNNVNQLAAEIHSDIDISELEDEYNEAKAEHDKLYQELLAIKEEYEDRLNDIYWKKDKIRDKALSLMQDQIEENSSDI